MRLLFLNHLFSKVFLYFVVIVLGSWSGVITADVKTYSGDSNFLGNVSIRSPKGLKVNTILQNDSSEDISLDFRDMAFLIRKINGAKKDIIASFDSGSIDFYQGLSAMSLTTTASVLIGTALTTSGSATITGNFIVQNRADIIGQLGVTGPATVTSLTNTGSEFIGATLTVSGSTVLASANLTGALVVAGPAMVASLTNTGSVFIGSDLTVNGSLTVLGPVTTINSVVTTYSSIVGDDLTVGDSTSLYGDVGIGRIDRTYGSFTVSSSALFKSALTITGSIVVNAPVTLLSATVTGSTLVASDLIVGGSFSSAGNLLASNRVDVVGALGVTGPTTLSSLTTTGSGIVGTALTVSGSATVGSDSNNQSLLVTGTITQGNRNAFKVLGQGAIPASINSSTPTKLCTLNYTTTYAGAWVNLYFFGGTSGGDVEYKGSYFVTPRIGKSNVSTEETSVTSGGDIFLEASFAESVSSVDIKMVIKTPSTGSLTIDSGYIFYEVMGNKLLSVTL